MDFHFFLIFHVGVDLPDVVRLALQVAGGEEGGHHGMVLVVVFVHAVAPDGLEIFKGVKVAAHDAEMLVVGGVVDGVPSMTWADWAMPTC